MSNATETPLEACVIRRVSWRLLPLLFASYFVAYIDRVNVSFAALSMNKALSLSAAQFGLAGGLFFLGWMIMSTPFSIVLGSLVSQPILSLNGTAGLAGWQWLFILQALPTLLLGVILFFALPDGPERASWLPADEKSWLTARLAGERAAREQVHCYSVHEVMLNPTIWLMSLGGMGINAAAYALILFLPQIIKGLGVSTAMTPLVNAIPFAVASLVMIPWARHSDRHGERNWHAAIPALVAALALFSCIILKNPVLMMLALTLGITGVFCFVSVFWVFPSAMLTGAAAAGGFALINTIANLGSFLGPYMLGWVRDWTGSFQLGLMAIGLGPLLATLVALSVRSVRRFEAAEGG